MTCQLLIYQLISCTCFYFVTISEKYFNYNKKATENSVVLCFTSTEGLRK